MSRTYCHTHSKYDCPTCADEILSLGIQSDKDRIAALESEVARLEACAARMEWQPIETAPKDGVVLLCLPIFGAIREGDRRVYEGRWHNEQDTFTSVNGFILLTGATHWMPLPSAPEGKK